MIISEAPRTLTQELTTALRLVTAGALAVLTTLVATACWFAVVTLPRINDASHVVATARSVELTLEREGSADASLARTTKPTSHGRELTRLRSDLRSLLRSSSPGVRLAARQLTTEPTAQRAADSHRLVAAALAYQTTARRSAVALTAGATGIVLVLAGGLFVWTLHRRRQLRRQVVGPVRSLLQLVRAVGRGDFGSNPPRVGAAELVKLRDELVDMSMSLRQQREVLAIRADEAVQAARRLSHIADFARQVSASLTLNRVLEVVVTSSRQLLNSPRARVWLVSEDGRTLRLAHDSQCDDITDLRVAQPIGAGGVGRAIRQQRLSFSPGLTGETVGSACGVIAMSKPLIKGTAAVGVLEVELTLDSLGLGSDIIEVLDAMAGHAATAIDAAVLYTRIEALSLSDSLTGLANRRRFDEDIAVDIERSKRSGRSLSMVMLDVDHFKALNDTLGHGTGDTVLREIGRTLAGQMRAGDTAYRVGGEEFAVLLRDTDRPGAAIVAERLRATVEQRYLRDSSRHVTVSVGLASLPEHSASAAGLMAAADVALYDAKRAGRNRVVVSSTAVPAQRTASESLPALASQHV